MLEPSNFCCPPAKPGVYLTEIIFRGATLCRSTSDYWPETGCLVTFFQLLLQVINSENANLFRFTIWLTKQADTPTAKAIFWFYPNLPEEPPRQACLSFTIA